MVALRQAEQAAHLQSCQVPGINPKATYNDLLKIIQVLRQRLAAQQAKLDYREALDTCPKFGSNGNLRSFVYRLNELEQREQPQADGPYKGLYCIPCGDLAASYGVDESHPGRQAALLKAHGLMEYEVQEHYITEDGRDIRVSWGRLSPSLKSTAGLSTLDDDPLTKQGGDHYICQKIINGIPCGGRIKRKKRVIEEQIIETCEACGDEVVFPPQRVGKVDPRYLKRQSEQVVHDSNIAPENNLSDSTCIHMSAETASPDPQKGGSEQLVPESEEHESEQVVRDEVQESVNQIGSTDSPEPEWFDAIPAELREWPHGVCWRYGTVDLETGKRRKVPYDAKKFAPLYGCDYTEPASWASFEKALDTYEQSQKWKMPYEGIGFCFSKDDPYCGIDLDNCRDPETGELNEEALQLIHDFPTYWEVSPSGTGIKGIVKGHIPTNIKTASVELYDHDRYFTMTGKQLPGTPNMIGDCQEQLDILYQQIAPSKPENALPSPTCSSIAEDDQELIERAMHARNGPGAPFTALWNNDVTTWRQWYSKANGSPDYSRADWWLVKHLAFYTGNDADRVDTLFRGSGLMRPKWDEIHGKGKTYGQLTIEKVISPVRTSRLSSMEVRP